MAREESAARLIDQEISSKPLDDEPDGETKRPVTWRDVLAISRPFFTGKDTRHRAWFWLMGCLTFTATETAIMLSYSHVNNEYMSALQEKDSAGFEQGLRKLGMIFAILVPVLTLQQYTSRKFMLEWRMEMTNRLAKRYFANRMYYRTQLGRGVDNPDQRITDDVGEFVKRVFNLVNRSASALFSMVAFMGVLYSISPNACAGVLVYAFIGTLISTKGFAPWLVKYKFLTVKQRADLRYCLIRTRENADSIAFFDGGEAEEERFGTFFNTLCETMYRKIIVTTCFGTFNRTFQFATFLVPTLLVAPSYLAGHVKFGAISQAGIAFNLVLSGLTLVMSRLESLTDVAVRVKRLRSLEELMHREEQALAANAAQTQRDPVIQLDALGFEQETLDLPTLEVQGLALITPPRQGSQQRALFEDVSFTLQAGNSILIVGDSGIGKSSLFRAIAGLWSNGRGHISRCGGKNVFFLPQKPYMFLGTLREQLLYPYLHYCTHDDSALQSVLNDVNLGYLSQRHTLDEVKEWGSVLSVGEQQRINFSRVLLQSDVRLALIDEGTSACDMANEAVLYDRLKQRVASYVSIGQRPALRKYHTHVMWLRMRRGGSLINSSSTGGYAFMTMAEYEKALEDAEAWGSTR